MTTLTKSTLKTYRFTLTLGGLPEIPAEVTDAQFGDRMDSLMDEICGRVLAAGCDDASLCSRGSTVFLGFDREADSLGDAVGSAIGDVERAGFNVVKVVVDGDAPDA